MRERKAHVAEKRAADYAVPDEDPLSPQIRWKTWSATECAPGRVGPETPVIQEQFAVQYGERAATEDSAATKIQSAMRQKKAQKHMAEKRAAVEKAAAEKAAAEEHQELHEVPLWPP